MHACVCVFLQGACVHIIIVIYMCITQATHTCMELDTTLLGKFTDALHECRIDSADEIVLAVHSSLLNSVQCKVQ